MATVALKSTAGKWILISTILASSMAFIDATALNVVLPALQKSLNAAGTELFWILNAYLLILASLILIGGSLGDKLGRKKVFIAGIVVFIAGSASCGFAPNVITLIICRIVQGIGGAFMIPGSLSLISSSINEEERGKAIGTWSAFTTLVTMGGPVLGGGLADAGLWRYIFFINVPVGIIAGLILIFKVKENKDNVEDKSLDFAGAIVTALGLAALTFGFLRIPALGLYHVQVIAPLAAGIVLLVAFIIIERKSKNPMMPLGMFTNSTFSGANLLSLFLYAALGAGMLFLSLDMVQAQGYSQLQSGLTFLPFTILMITIARFAGTLADKHGPRFFLVAGPSAVSIGLMMLSLIKQTSGPVSYWYTFFPGIVVFGLGMSFTVAPLTTAVMGAAGKHLSGTASGINNAVTRIANVFANAVFGALAILFFTGTLQKETQPLQLSPTAEQAVMKEAANLGDAEPPKQVKGFQKKEIEAAYRESFITAYGNVMRIAAVLAFVGALMSFLFIKNEHIRRKK